MRSLEWYEGEVEAGLPEKSSATLEGRVPEPVALRPSVDAGTVWGRFRDRGSGKLGRTSESLASRRGRYRDCPPRSVEMSVKNRDT